MLRRAGRDDSIGGVEITPQLNENDGRPVKVITIKSIAVAKIRAFAFENRNHNKNNFVQQI